VTAIHARGIIAMFQTIFGLINASTVAVAYFLVKQGVGPVSVGWALLAVTLGSAVFRVLWIRGTFGVSPRRWMREVAWPCVAVGTVTFAVAVVVKAAMPESFLRLSLVCGLSAGATSLVAWLVALNAAERQFVLSNMTKVLHRMSFYFGIRGCP